MIPCSYDRWVMVNQTRVVLRCSMSLPFDGSDKLEGGPCELVAALQPYGLVPWLIDIPLHEAGERVYL